MDESAIEYYNEGYCYFSGEEDYPINYSKAYENFLIAAELGYGPAMNYLGILYQEGCGVPQDENRAFEWYTRAAEANDAYGLYNLGRYYLDGIGRPEDEEKAMMYFKQSFELEQIPEAAYNLGCDCMAKKEYIEAGNLFYYAAQKIDMPEAWHNLGYLIVNQKITLKSGSGNHEYDAANMYKKAAEQGYAPSMDEYGRILLSMQNKEEAYYWIKSAADMGYEPAKKRLRLLNFTSWL